MDRFRKAIMLNSLIRAKTYHADEIGVLKLTQEPKDDIKTGNVGYIISGIKEAKEVKVGDTITKVDRATTNCRFGF